MARARGTRTLAIDVGGTGLKAAVLDAAGRMVTERAWIATPYPCRPDILLRALADLTRDLPASDRISIGFPGVVRAGRTVTAPHFDAEAWRDFPLQAALSQQFGKPARLLNDAEVQGLGLIGGRGLELVLTLGTGVGSAIFSSGRLTPHLELAHHPIHKNATYNDYVGKRARAALSAKKWNRRVLKLVETVYGLLHYDTLHIGGGNAAHLRIKLPDNVRIASNDAGITGGIHLWDDAVWRSAQERDARPPPRRRGRLGPKRLP